GTGDGGYKIPQEFSKTHHLAGVLSMARGPDVNSAGTQFFICLEDSPHLDGQYSAFGRVADEESQATVRAIGAVKTERDNKPLEKVVIKKATVNETPKS